MSHRYGFLLAMVSLVACGSQVATQAPAEDKPAPSSPAPAAAAPSVVADTSRSDGSCSPDPRVPWLAARDRACHKNEDCEVLAASSCELVPMHRSAQERYDEKRCRFDKPNACACSLPLTTSRCHDGCCQMTIGVGVDAVWRP